MNTIENDFILVLDFGSQYTQLIARRVRELGVYSEIHPFDLSIEDVKSMAPKGIILSGGPQSVTEAMTARVAQDIFNLNVPILGICYGMQTMAEQLGGQVKTSDHQEFGHAIIELEPSADSLLNAISESQDHAKSFSVWMSHGDQVTDLPPGFRLTAQTSSTPVAAMADESRHFYGVQFHPEVTHTPFGQALLHRFVLDICQTDATWQSTSIIEHAIASIRDTVGQSKVLLGLSGGVDSAVAAALLHKAIGDQLLCIFVDNGLLRLNEACEVMAQFKDKMHINVIKVDAKQLFLDKLHGLSDPEEKRKAIGRTFIEVFEQQAKQFNDFNYLAQGTIYPDVIESAGAKFGKAHLIKSHHNVGGLPERMQLTLVEPLRDLFKDEVRKIGVELGLPKSQVYRHPFPGPGLGVRVLGEIKELYLELLRKADAIFMEELINQGYYHEVNQAFAVFLPVKSVGVVGDGRRYEYVIALRAVKTTDFMTAHWAQLPYELLGHVANRIINEISGISRVVYDISSKPPATIEWE